jgi:hypothetical protein
MRLPELSDIPPAYTASDSARSLAVALAPMLYIQHDETFPLVRIAAVIHPTRPIIAYHLLWSHDVDLQWVPWAEPSDEEVVWVGYDSVTKQPTDLWTYWHGVVLHTPWVGLGRPAVNVQWGKHGSLPRGVIESDLPRTKTLNVFYVAEFVFLPDILVGKIAHGGPWGFFHGYDRYRLFDRPTDVAEHLDAVLQSDDPRAPLSAVFGRKYSNKVHWPWDAHGDASRKAESLSSAKHPAPTP